MLFKRKRKKEANMKTTSWIVSGLGLVVSTLGATVFRRKKIGTGVLGFGIAHIILGQLARLRPMQEK